MTPIKRPVPETISRLRGGLIVSCQAPEGNPLRQAPVIAAMALAAIEGGAVAIRVNGPGHVRAVREYADLPVIGLQKIDEPGFDVRITPTVSAALRLLEAGASIVAADATGRPRPGGESLEAILEAVRERGGLFMADCSTLEEGERAAAMGADLIGTTLSGYTPYSPRMEGPDLDLVSALARRTETPVVAEGRYWHPEEAVAALDRGAWAVVVGTAVTRPDEIARRFTRAMEQ